MHTHECRMRRAFARSNTTTHPPSTKKTPSTHRDTQYIHHDRNPLYPPHHSIKHMYVTSTSPSKSIANEIEDVAIAIPRVNDILTSIHVCIIGTFLVVAAFILLFSIRLHKAISRYRDKDVAVTTSPWRSMPTTAEQSLIPNSPIAVQYEYNDDDGDVEAASQQSPVVPRSPPPAYGRVG
jgi:hypothetical protein